MTFEVYQPLYRPGQTLTDDGFAPFVHGNERASWRELQFIIKIFDEGLHRRHDLVGLFSPRFTEKTRMTSADVRDFIEDNPGGEIYTFVAHPYLPYFTYNVWTNGEELHPGLIDVAQGLLDAAGLPFDLPRTGRHPADIWCMCNFWVGSTRFWEAYVGEVLRPLATYLERNSENPAVQAALLDTRHTRPTPFLPFIVERLFTAFLGQNPHWRPLVRQCIAWNAPILTDFDRDVIETIGERIDQADRAGDYPRDLIVTMELLRRLRKRFLMEYYSTHPHPNTGLPMESSRIKEVLADLEKWPRPRL